MSSEKSDICWTFYGEMSGGNSKCPAKYWRFASFEANVHSFEFWSPLCHYQTEVEFISIICNSFSKAQQKVSCFFTINVQPLPFYLPFPFPEPIRNIFCLMKVYLDEIILKSVAIISIFQNGHNILAKIGSYGNTTTFGLKYFFLN